MARLAHRSYAKIYVKNQAKIVSAMKRAGLPKGSIDGVKERIGYMAWADKWNKLPGTIARPG